MTNDNRFDEIQNMFPLPSLKQHGDCESIFNEFWNFEKDLTFEELLQCKAGGEDHSGEEVCEGTLAEVFEATKELGFWAFSNTITNEIHVWNSGGLLFRELLALIAHEFGHLVENHLQRGAEETDEAFEERKADGYAWAAVWANHFALTAYGKK